MSLIWFVYEVAWIFKWKRQHSGIIVMSKPICVLIADHFQLVRAGLRLLLAQQPNIEVVGEATCAPDVILLDLDLPRKKGAAVVVALKQRNPAAHIPVLTGLADDDLMRKAIQASAEGYLLKTVTIPELIWAIHAVYHGEMSLHPHLARQLFHPPSGLSPLAFTLRTGIPLSSAERMG
jgi:DNA-binding NarL/FixJ family response regulator